MIWDKLIEMITAVSIWELLFILFAKTFEVTIATIRMILINKGFRKPGAFLAVFEILLWVFIASRVILGITEFPIKGLVYAMGFASGVYIGSLLEDKLAVGKILINVIVDHESGRSITDFLRASGYGVTVMDAHGKDSARMVIMVFANRKNKYTIIELIEKMDPKAFIVANEVSILHGGYLSPWRRIAK
jgi:uncharacterized protein YebE (UPF0316 family)